jgi:hypothetical protein
MGAALVNLAENRQICYQIVFFWSKIPMSSWFDEKFTDLNEKFTDLNEKLRV